MSSSIGCIVINRTCRLRITDLVQAGENHLEIEVVNLWRNRMIKDKQLPAEDRYSWTVVDDIKPGEELQYYSIALFFGSETIRLSDGIIFGVLLNICINSLF